MERRAASHTEEEEMNQRRRLLNQARKGDAKAISKLFELYQVRVFSGEMLNKLNRAYAGKAKQAHGAPATSKKSAKKRSGVGKKAARHAHPRVARQRPKRSAVLRKKK